MSAQEIDLSWANADPTLSVVVMRALDGSADFQPLATLDPGTSSYADADPALTADTHYDYVVVGQDAYGDSSPNSGPADAWTSPAAPTALTATAASPTEADLVWT